MSFATLKYVRATTMKATGNDPNHDAITRFSLDDTGVRGVLVRLDSSWRELLSHADYPAPVIACLGESCAASALFTGHIKTQARLSVQMRGTGSVRTIYAECTAAGTLDRKSVVSGQGVSVRVDLGGRRIIQKKKTTNI